MNTFVDLLTSHGVSTDDLVKAQAYQEKYGGRLEQILVNMGGLSAEVLPNVYSAYLGCRTLDAGSAQSWVPPELEPSTPLDMLIEHGWIPFSRTDDGRLTFATKSPLDLDVNEWLTETGLDYQVLLASDDQFTQLRNRFGTHGDSSVAFGLDIAEEGRLRELASETPTVNMLNSLLARALRQRASDLHIEPYGSGARVRYRIDGVLHDVDAISTAMVLPVITRLKILAKMDIGERRRPQDGKIELRIAGEEIDIRASVIPVAGGESAVLRFLRKNALVYDIKVLGLSADIERLLLEDLAVTSGVVLLTGPTGSGKTTTLYSFLSRLNTSQVKIITLEDPVEYQLEGINQIQVQPAIGFDFANGLRSVVRQDPDVIMVGEIRDRETASVAMQSALTGHLVFSTVHTNDSPSAYTRLLDLGVEEFLLNAALRSVVGQRLARKLCDECSVPSTTAAVSIEKFDLLDKARAYGIEQINLRDARGCDACGGTGYRGRVALAEYLRCDAHIRALPKGPDFIAQAKQHARSEGWRTLIEDGLYKAMTGVTTIPEVMRVAG
jgi:general secretion pathway protein E